MRIIGIALLGIATSIAAAGLLAGQEKPSDSIPMPVGLDTSKIVEPLHPDGTVNYLAAIDARARQGLTKDNNFAITLLETLGPSLLPQTIRARTLELLGLNLPEEGDYLQTPPSLEQDAAHAAPWRREQYPELAQRVDTNRKHLDALVEGAKRPRFYVPLVSPDQPSRLWNVSSGGNVSRACWHLSARAMLRIGMGELDAARQDLTAILRLGRLSTQDWRDGVYQDRACDGPAATGFLAIARDSQLTAPVARAILADFNALPARVSEADHIDQGQRYTSLERIMRLQVSTVPRGVQSLGFGSLDCDPQSQLGARSNCRGVSPPPEMPIAADFNAIAKTVNGYYDDVVMAWRAEPFNQRARLFRTAQDRWFGSSTPADRGGALRTLESTAFWNSYAAMTPEEKRRALTPLLLSRFASEEWGAAKYEQETIIRSDLVRIAVALAAYRAQKSEYPDALNRLVPDYLQQVLPDPYTGAPFLYERVAVGDCSACGYRIESGFGAPGMVVAVP